MAVRPAHPRVLPHGSGPGHLQEEPVATGQVHTLHSSHTGMYTYIIDTAIACTNHCSLSLSPLQFTSPEQVSEKAPSGCYVSGLYLEGAQWDVGSSSLTMPLPKVLVEELPILRVIPIEAQRLKLVVSWGWWHS